MIISGGESRIWPSLTCRFDDQSFKEEALILCLVYIDGLASCYYGAGRARGKNKEHFCKALSKLSGDPVFEKLHGRTTCECVGEKLPEATALVIQLVTEMPGQLLEEAEVRHRIGQSPLAGNQRTKNFLKNLWHCSIGAICYDIMGNAAVHGLGTAPLAFGETLWDDGKGFCLDFAVLYNALKRICEHVAKESAEKEAWFGHSNFMKTTSRVNRGEQLAVEFFADHKMRVERFSKKEMHRTQTPDFKVFKADELVAYCEAKHIQQDAWLENQMRNARPGEIVGGARPDPVFNRLETHIHEATAQFEAVNYSGDFANILVFANSDQLCEFSDLIRVLTGNEYTESGQIEPMFKVYSEGRIRLEKRKIDLFVWKDIWPGGDSRIPFIYVEGSKHRLRLCNLLGSDPAGHRKLDASMEAVNLDPGSGTSNDRMKQA